MNYYGTEEYKSRMKDLEEQVFSKIRFDEPDRIKELESGYSIKYYYYIVSQQDETANKKVYRFTDFFCMDSEQEHYSSDGSSG